MMERIQSHPGSVMLRHRAATGLVIDRLRESPEPRILSFGSSWGAEIVPIAAALPQARIHAAELDDVAIEHARGIFRQSPNVSVHRSDWEAIKCDGPYDAILANAVICKYPNSSKTSDLNDVFPFKEFEIYIRRLDAMLRRGGLLVAYNMNYSLFDAAAGQHYRLVSLPPSMSYLQFDNFVSLFDRNGHKLIHHHVALPGLHLDIRADLKAQPQQVIRLLNEGVFFKGREQDMPEAWRRGNDELFNDDVRPPAGIPVRLPQVYRAEEAALDGFYRLPADLRVRYEDGDLYVGSYWGDRPLFREARVVL